MMKVSLLLLAVVATAISGVSARIHHKVHAPVAVAAPVSNDACQGKDYGTAGEFDFYVFAQSWPAQFCTLKPNYPGCVTPTDWQRVNLTLHGMWPNYNKPVGGHGWPQCCASTFGSDLSQAVVNELLTDLQLYWPNEQDPSGTDIQNSLWGHEWGKHGTCSGLPQKAYLQQAMDIEAGMPTPELLQKNAGGSVALSDLKAAYNIQDCVAGGDCDVGFNCAKKGNKLYLSGVTTCWDPNFTQVKCPASVLGSQGKQCTDANVYLYAFA